MNALVKSINGKLAEIDAAANKTARSIEGSFDRAGGAAEKAAKRAASKAGAKPDKSADRAAAAAKSQGAAVSKAATKVATAASTTAKNVKTAAEKAEEARQAQRDGFDKLIGALQLNLDRAAATKGFKDDLSALSTLEKAVRAQIKVEGRTVELQRQLFDIAQQRKEIAGQIAQARTDRQQAAQFKALGLSASGGDRIPGVENLRKQLASLGDRVTGTPIDTTKLRTQLDGVRKVLSGAFGKATEETRAKIKELFAAIRGELSDGSKGALTAGRKLDVNKIADGLGLSGDALKQLQGRLSRISPDGTVAVAGRSAFGRQLPATEVSVFLDGNRMEPVVTTQQQKRNGRTSRQTRGRFAGI
jgi:hypothetical protein